MEQTQQYVGIDLHRRRTVLVRMDAEGETLETVRIENDPGALEAVLARAGSAPEVAMEATLGWYWAADVITETEANLHLADLLRMGRLPEAWIAPPELRELREAVRFRHKLVFARANAKSQVHGVLAKAGVKVPVSDLFGLGGNQLLDGLALVSAPE